MFCRNLSLSKSCHAEGKKLEIFECMVLRASDMYRTLC
jgi:hypothetical protein